MAQRILARGPNLGQKTTLAYTFFDGPALIDGNAVCREWLGKVDRYTPLYGIVTDFDLACDIVKTKEASWAYGELVEKFGERMLPVLLELAKAPFDRWHAKDVAEALALFDDPIAAQGMLKLLELAASRPLAIMYFARFPRHADAALASIEGVKGRGAKIAREVLAGAKRALASAVPQSDEAQLGEIPSALASPPWLAEKEPKRPCRPKLALLRIDVPEERRVAPRRAATAPSSSFPSPTSPRRPRRWPTTKSSGPTTSTSTSSSTRTRRSPTSSCSRRGTAGKRRTAERSRRRSNTSSRRTARLPTRGLRASSPSSRTGGATRAS